MSWQVYVEGAEGGSWRLERAEDLLAGLEEGRYTLNTLARSGAHAIAHPLRRLMRELVWSAREDARAAEVGTRQEAYLDLVAHSPVPAAISDLGGRLKAVNDALCAFLGYPRDELIGMTVGALSHPEDHAREGREARGLLAGRARSLQMEKRYITKGGEERVGALSLVLLHTPDGEPYAALALIADLTPLKRLQEERARARTLSAVTEMAQRITHDLKNLLMVLQGTLDLLQDSAPQLSAEDQELISSGLRMCQSGEALVRSLLDLSAEPAAPLAPLSLRELLWRLTPTLTRAAAPSPLSVEVLLEEAACVLGDSLLLERALLNLCVNAHHAIEEARAALPPRDHAVTVALREAREEERARWGAAVVVLEVRDTGVGIPAHLHAKILEPYATTRRGRGGHGLGLATVQAVCAQLGGALELESAEGAGASFRVILPRAPCLGCAEAP